jgi:serine protease
MISAGVVSLGTPEAAAAPSAAAGATVRVVYRMHPNLVTRAAGWLAARGVSPESAAGASSSRQVTPHLSDVDMRAIDVPADKVDAVLAALKQRGDLEWAERATPVRKHGDAPAPATAGAPIATNSITAPTDPYYSLQWGIAAGGASIAWPRAAAVNAGTAIRVAVVDTGVQVDHPDLVSRLAPNSTWGRCDSGTCLAYAATDAQSIPTDGDGHGTHVAGIVAAATDNAVGVVGVAGNRPVSIIPVKVLSDNGSGTTDAVAAGISWAVSKGAKVINLSLGSSANTQAINTAIDGAVNAGVLVVVSAGNCGGASWSLNGCSAMNSADYPAGYAVTATGAGKVIPVAASTSSGGIASFSTQQTYVATAGVAAPGDTITSTFNGSSYASMSGTSMASPYVAGGAALVWSTYPTLTRVQVRDILRASATTNATTLASPNAFGAGLINLDAALTAAAVAVGGATPVIGSPTATRTVAPTATIPPTATRTIVPTATRTVAPTATATVPPTVTRTIAPTATKPSATATQPTSPAVTATKPASPTRTPVPTATPRRPGWWWDGWRR